MILLIRIEMLVVFVDFIEKIKQHLKTSILASALAIILLISGFQVNSQCTIIPTAVPVVSLGFVQTGGTNSSGVAFNPNLSLYYAGIAGNPGFPLETFNIAGTPLYQTNTGFDIRGLWWNFNLDQLEANGYNSFGVWTFNLNGAGHALNTGSSVFTGMNQPTVQSVGDYNCIEDEIWYYNAGTLQKRSHATGALISTLTITGLPVGTGNLNNNSVFYTDCLGHEIGLVDYQLKRIYFADKITGAYSGMSQLPATTVVNNSFRASWANGLAFLYDVGTRTWFGFQVLTGFNVNCSVVACTPPILITDDLVACSPNTVDLNTGINAGSGVGNAQFYATLADVNGSINPISNTVSTSGMYYVGYEDPTDATCFSVDSILVTINPIYNLIENVNACENSTVTYPDGSTAIITASTSYTSNLTTVAACDSIIVTNVTMDPNYNIVSNINACENSTVTYPDGSTAVITVSTSYTSNMTTVAGCDSVIVTNVTMDPNYNIVSNVIACENSTVTYPDGATAVITASTSYTSNLTSAAGCDSIIVTNVTMSPTYNIVSSINTCQNSTITYPDGSTAVITASTSYTSNMTTAAGCDSIIVTNVTMGPIATVILNVNACENSIVTYPDGSTATITASTSYTSNLINAAGCDSIVETNVTMDPIYNIVSNINACENAMVTYPDGSTATITASTSYTSNMTTVAGCDSIIVTNVTMDPIYNIVSNVNACENSTVTYPDGSTAVITASTSYTSNMTTVAGCDSIIVTNVTMAPIYNIVSNINACENSTVTYPDGSTATITASTSFTSNMVTVAGCDSIIVTNVTMDPIYNIVSNVDACENSTVTYPDGSTEVITASTSHSSNLTTTAGCDSIIVTNVTISFSTTSTVNEIVCFGAQYTSPQGNSYGVGSFDETLVSAVGCDSVVTYVVTETSLITSAITGNVCFGEQYISPNGNTYGGGVYTEILTAASGCDSVVTITVFESDPVVASFYINESDLTTLNTDVTFLNTSSGANSYIWTFGHNGQGSFEESPVYSYPLFESTTYIVTLIAIDQAGCSDTLIRPIFIEEELIYFVPNTFTPDGDALNNTFQPVFNSGYDPFDFSLLIFNRWGELVFESHDVTMGWDGTYNGKYVQDGTYTWKLEFKLKNSDERKIDVGHVIMMR